MSINAIVQTEYNNFYKRNIIQFAYYEDENTFYFDQYLDCHPNEILSENIYLKNTYLCGIENTTACKIIDILLNNYKFKRYNIVINDELFAYDSEEEINTLHDYYFISKYIVRTGENKYFFKPTSYIISNNTNQLLNNRFTYLSPDLVTFNAINKLNQFKKLLVSNRELKLSFMFNELNELMFTNNLFKKNNCKPLIVEIYLLLFYKNINQPIVPFKLYTVNLPISSNL